MAITRTTSPGARGKYAEGKVKAELEKRAQKMSFVYYRPPDARAGSKKEAPGDFITVTLGGTGITFTDLLEVKEVAHDFRLPKKNFPQEQRARMRMWQKAGVEGYLLVLHTTTGNWRVIGISEFDGDFEDKGSWDLKDYTERTLQEALGEIYQC